MARSINMATLQGRVGGDPEIRSLNSVAKVANFSVATSEAWKDKATGEKKEKTEWHRVVVWNDGLVGVLEKYLRKGMVVTVIGQIETREWEKDGVKRRSTEIVVKGFGHTVNFFETAKSEGGRSAPENVGRPRANIDLDDEIPF
ncbi:MAG: single-stranded DNA-binding protein [Methylacidiphilales bacterium]|nr:single-stranded DNA-binding protein [Candidatus Methylacidiphilales bacterium]